MFEAGNVGAEVAAGGIPVASFALMNLMPLKRITIPFIVLALFFSFITLADAMTGNVASITIKDTSADEAPVPVKFFWGALTGLATFLCLFLLGSGGMTALQNLSIVYAMPIYIFTFISVGSLIKMVNGTVDREFAAMTEEERTLLSRGRPIGK